jgi:hypothetical protein
MKRQVNVDLDELAIALDTDFSELHQYLDLETGRIVSIVGQRGCLDEVLHVLGGQQITGLAKAAPGAIGGLAAFDDHLGLRGQITRAHLHLLPGFM